LCPARGTNQEKFQFKSFFESQERDDKKETNADIRYYQLFSGNILDVVSKDQLRTSVDLWMFRMRSLNRKSSVNFE